MSACYAIPPRCLAERSQQRFCLLPCTRQTASHDPAGEAHSQTVDGHARAAYRTAQSVRRSLIDGSKQHPRRSAADNCQLQQYGSRA